MPDTKKLLDVVTSAKPGVLFGRVSALLDDAVLVSCGEGAQLVACDLLDLEAGQPDALAEGERVLVVVPEGGGVALRVHNEGPPIPPELLQEAFEPFRRGVAGGEGGSLGLGLFIVREVVRAHGGTVEVASAAGEGTTFTVRLPTRPPPEAEASSGRPAPER